MDTRCPYCQRINEEHTSVNEDAKPKPGDASVCWGCAGVGVYDAQLQTVVPDDFTMAELLADPTITQAVDAVRAARGPLPGGVGPTPLEVAYRLRLRQMHA